jgi:two-component system, NtrC family, nitrogen regulation sensor histidine kinase NtrY
MNHSRPITSGAPGSARDRSRQKRELVLIAACLVVVALLTYAETRIIYFGADFPISNTILMFILINLNLLLLLLVIFLVFRNLVKLLYDRKRKVLGSRLTTRLVFSFIALSLAPTTVLFFFSLNFITTSIEYWFNVPVEQALDNSLQVGRRVYDQLEESNRFFLERIAYQIKAKNLLLPNNQKALARYIEVVQRSFNLHAVEVYSTSLKRLAYAVAPALEESGGLRHLDPDSLQRQFTAAQVHTVTRKSKDGELARTIATVPFGVKSTQAEAFITASKLIPLKLSDDMASISRGVAEYHQIKLLKQPIKITYYITLSIVALLVVFCAVWFGIHLAKSISIPIRDLGEATRRVAEGDLSFRIMPVADDEIGRLVDSFNQMTRDLQVSRAQLEQSARKLREQNSEIEEKRQYMAIVLKNVSAGVISLDADGLVSTINTAAEKMLNLQFDEIIGQSYKKLLRGQHLNLADEVMGSLATSSSNAIALPLRLAVDGKPRSFMVHINALKNDAGEHMGIVMVFDDLTDLEKAQRMAAWREVARRIAHEVKNPLTPISLSAQRLKRKYGAQINEPVFDECTRTIIDHVELIRNLVNEFSAFARFPTADPNLADLPPIVEETIALYREGHPNIHFKFFTENAIPRIKLDRQQIKQALINLVDNAVASIKKEGSITIHLSHDPILKSVRMEVADTGEGVSDEDKTHLFEPYFSTKKAGMGLGLTIVSSIISDHNGMIGVQDNKPQGAKFVIELPA